LRRYVRTYD